MRVIYNKYLPLGNFRAINLLGFIFARSDYGFLDKESLQHEYIHTLQQREMLFVFFYLFYLIEWIVRILQYRNNYLAYRNISFEREAYSNEADSGYPQVRSFWSWAKYLHAPTAH